LLFSGQRAQPSPQFDGWFAEHDGNEHQVEIPVVQRGGPSGSAPRPSATAPVRQPRCGSGMNDA
jgi:hypothetical protein